MLFKYCCSYCDLMSHEVSDYHKKIDAIQGDLKTRDVLSPIKSADGGIGNMNILEKKRLD